MNIKCVPCWGKSMVEGLLFGERGKKYLCVGGFGSGRYGKGIVLDKYFINKERRQGKISKGTRGNKKNKKYIKNIIKPGGWKAICERKKNNNRLVIS
jgi:hypothetical protein